MPNVTPAKYTVQLGPTVVPEVAGEVYAWAEMLGISASAVARECLNAGLEVVRSDFRARAALLPAGKRTGGEIPGAVLRRQLAYALGRGERQVGSRRSYDRRTRIPGAGNAAHEGERESTGAE